MVFEPVCDRGRFSQRLTRTAVGLAYLKQRMTSYNLEESFETFAASLDDLVRKAVCEHLSRQCRDINSCAFAFKDVSKGFKVRADAAT